MGQHDFPRRLTAEKAAFEQRTVEENGHFLIDTIRNAYLSKCSHEDPEAVKGLERYIVLGAVDKLWQEHLSAWIRCVKASSCSASARKTRWSSIRTKLLDVCGVDEQHQVRDPA